MTYCYFLYKVDMEFIRKSILVTESLFPNKEAAFSCWSTVAASCPKASETPFWDDTPAAINYLFF